MLGNLKDFRMFSIYYN